MPRGIVGVLCVLLALCGCGGSDDGDHSTGTTLTDPGSGPWIPVPAAQVAEKCGLDPALLAAADVALNRPYAVIRYGQLCHEFYPSGRDSIAEVYSASGANPAAKKCSGQSSGWSGSRKKVGSLPRQVIRR